MGNTHGRQKEECKSKRETKCQKEAQKKQKQHKSNDNKDASKHKRGQKVPELDDDIDGSSRVTGGDSESCVFHSAENISVGPYLDSSSRSEFEHGTTPLQNSSTCSQHSYVLSSKDFQDGFSLEACIPPEIARPETVNVTSPATRVRYGHKLLNPNYDSFHSEATAHVSESVNRFADGREHGPSISSVGDAENPTSSGSSPMNIDQETSRSQAPQVLSSSCHHPHFYNHHHDRRYPRSDLRYVTRPSPPQTQTTPAPNNAPSSCKLASNTTLPPTTPAPQRRAANLLSLFRSSSKLEKATTNDGNDRQIDKESNDTSADKVDTVSAIASGEFKVKSKPKWKTWERSRSSKSKQLTKVSIFGTSRKTDQSFDSAAGVMKQEMKHGELENSHGCSPQPDNVKHADQHHQISSIIFTEPNDGTINSAISSLSRVKSRNGDSMLGEIETNASPHVSTTAAFCILKLEELERSIEKTIREKFPDAEPFLLRQPSKEELGGSRSLPTTPSLKKKLYITRDHDSIRCRKCENTTRYCQETFESLPSPARSPVVIRRFGARTRHASISPKIARAKTAALFNSPSEISSSSQHKVSIMQWSVPDALARLDNLSSAKKSVSKYDNVIETGTSASYFSVNENMVNKDSTNQEGTITPDTDNKVQSVIIPTSSAVFGSVSPKLKRHNQLTFNRDNDGADKNQQPTAVTNGADKNQQPTAITNGADKNQQPTAITNGADKNQQPTAITDGANKNQQPTAITNGADKNQQLTATTDGADKNQQPTAITDGAHFDGDSERRIKHLDTSHIDTTASLQSSGCPFIVSDTVSVFSKQPEKRQEASIGNFVSESLDKSKERSTKKPHLDSSKARAFTRIISDHPASINRPILEERADSVALRRGRNPGTDKCNQHAARRHEFAIQEEKPSTAPLSQPACIKTTQPHGISRTNIVNTPRQITSRGAAQKHSTDRALSDAALSCRTSSLSLEPETVRNVNSSHVAQDTVFYSSNDSRLASHQHFAESIQSETKQSTQLSYSLSSASTCLLDTVGSDTRLSHAEQVVLKHGDVASSGHTSQSTAIQTQPMFVFPGHRRTTQLDSLTTSPDCPIRSAQAACQNLREDAESKNQELFYYSQTPSLLEDSEEQQNQQPQNSEIVTVLRHPVSEVISQMISLSHRQTQHRQINLQKQYRHLPTSASPVQSIQYVVPVVAIETIPKCEQSCQMMERPVTVQSKPLEDFGHQVRHDTSTDSGHHVRYDISTDGKLSSCGRSEVLEESRIQTIRESELHPLPTTDLSIMEDEQMTEVSDPDESEFLRKVLAGSKIKVDQNVDEKNTKEQVPPPSPSAVIQLMEEVSEEVDDVDDDIIENKEIVTTGKEQEMKHFTEMIYKRLSDLLSDQSKEDESLAGDQSKVVDGFTVGGDFVQGSVVACDYRNELDSSVKLDVCQKSFSRKRYEDTTRLDISATATGSGTSSALLKVLTIETSSSLSTTTSSESDIDESSLMFQTFQKTNEIEEEVLDNREGYVKRTIDCSELVFNRADIDRLSRDGGQTCSSRVYHSDDDVATGRGIPDYYDDRPLWSRRQKPPGQLSAAMMAIRWRERRDRWLKKRRRNRTDLLSTGSSDTGSENYHSIDYSQMSDSLDMDKKCTHQIDSVISMSPKYTKPILPFFGSRTVRNKVDGQTIKEIVPPRPRQSIRQHDRSKVTQDHFTRRERGTDNNHAHEVAADYNEPSKPEVAHSPVLASLDIATNAVEDTFHELACVGNILAVLEDERQTIEENSHSQCLPLTTENVRSIREYYKDFYLSSSGRRSRLSATDRTESDLDLYSEMRDEVSSGSEVYADDEGDDEGLEPYATAEDDIGALARISQRGDECLKEAKATPDAGVVISCTFYNSNTLSNSQDIDEDSSANETKTTHRSTFAVRVPRPHAILNSDEEFWTGSAAVDESYKQPETAADAVSSTFQNARDQMHDIQHHLQALRRQMEVMQDDLTNISITLNPNTCVENNGK